MYRTIVASFICLSFILVSCSTGKEKWEKQTVPEGGFSIMMPMPVEKFDKKETTAFGQQTTHYIRWQPSSFAMDKFKLFQAGYMNCPANIMTDTNRMNLMLDSVTEMRKRDFTESEIIESQSIEFNGYPGRAFFYDAPKGNTIVTVKICIANNRLYDLVVISKKNYATAAEMNNFFNSFVAQ
jgi:hypothetical protein